MTPCTCEAATGAVHCREEQTDVEGLHARGMSHLSTFTNFRLIRLVCNFELGSADSSPGPQAASGLQGGHAWLEKRAQTQ